MKTTATNRKIRELLTALKSGSLVPRPEFQRRLVWNNRDKSSFLTTVLQDYPFPEIYIAAGSVDVESGEGTEMLVDGQQRVTTLYQYFTASPELILHKDIKPYADLDKQQKEAFLQYDVVVRDLGAVPIAVIKNVFQRINATRYSLNAMEVQNARYEGEFKAFGEAFSQQPFFEAHRTFSAAEIRRMDDVRFALTIATSILGGYFHRDSEIEEFLKRYNDDFLLKDDLTKELNAVLELIDEFQMPANARIWKKADLFTAIVEIYSAIYKRMRRIDPTRLSAGLLGFYAEVDDPAKRSVPSTAAARYYAAALQASNDRAARLTRGELVRSIIDQYSGSSTNASDTTRPIMP